MNNQYPGGFSAPGQYNKSSQGSPYPPSPQNTYPNQQSPYPQSSGYAAQTPPNQGQGYTSYMKNKSMQNSSYTLPL